jgi:hypothetical protein
VALVVGAVLVAMSSHGLRRIDPSGSDQRPPEDWGSASSSRSSSNGCQRSICMMALMQRSFRFGSRVGLDAPLTIRSFPSAPALSRRSSTSARDGAAFVSYRDATG